MVNRQATLVAALLLVLVAATIGFVILSSGGAPTTSQGTTSSFSTTSSSSVSSISECGPLGHSASSQWTTYHGDSRRSGYVPSLPACAKAAWTSGMLDGEVYAEPLIYGGMVFVATENDTVYALNATSGATVWRTHLGTPMQGSALPCGNISPSGITGTPVIDPATNTIYAVAFVTPGAHHLVAMDTRDGKVSFSRSADAPGSDPLVQQERAALSLGNGRVYIPYGGLLGDCGQYYGRVAGINANGSGNMISYQVPTSREAGIWAPSGAAMDPTGNLYVTTGNGASDSSFDFSNSVIKLNPSLQELSYFAASNWLQLNQGDVDLGSVGPSFVGTGELFQIGKEGVGYLLNASYLGGIGGQIYSAQVCQSSYGGTAVGGSLVFVPCTDGMAALSVSANSFHLLWKTSSFPAGPPIVTGDVVWALDTSTGTLYGYRVDTGEMLYSFTTGGVTRFTTPATGDGLILVAAGAEVFAFQIW